MVQNKRWVFKQVPQGIPKPGQDIVVESNDFDLDQQPPQGGLIVKVLYLSLDPYLRGRMRAADVKSYTPALQLGSTIGNSVVAKVLKSASDKAKEGDFVVVGADAAEYAVVPKASVDMHSFYVIPKDRDEKLKLSYYVGVLGMPGRTAWSSLYKIGEPKKGETIWVSAASGPVGSIVGQVAKHEGMKVVGSVGSDEKLDYILKDLGFDAGFNYKKEKPSDALKRLAPDGIDIYYDNVGGEHLEAAIDHANNWARIVECGQIAEYSLPLADRYPIRNLFQIVSKRLKIQGFIVNDPGFGDRYFDEHLAGLSGWISDGSFTAREHVTRGLENVSEAFVAMLTGANEGKAVVQVAAEEE